MQLLYSSAADIVITVCDAARHPSFNMVRLDKENKATLAVPPEKNIVRRQDVQPLYDITTVAYAANPLYILREQSLFAGDVRALVIPRERSLDIDSEFDLRIAELLFHADDLPEKNTSSTSSTYANSTLKL